MSKTFILTGILIIAFFLADAFGFGRFLHPQKWIILSFFVAVSFLFHLLIEQSLRNSREKFVPFYLATVILRLLLSMIFVGIEFYWQIPQKQLFLLNFFVLYLCFTIFEISNLNRNLRRF